MPRAGVVDASWYDYPQYYDLAFREDTLPEADFIEAACRRVLRSFPCGGSWSRRAAAGGWSPSWPPGGTG